MKYTINDKNKLEAFTLLSPITINQIKVNSYNQDYGYAAAQLVLPSIIEYNMEMDILLEIYEQKIYNPFIINLNKQTPIPEHYVYKVYNNYDNIDGYVILHNCTIKNVIHNHSFIRAELYFHQCFILF